MNLLPKAAIIEHLLIAFLSILLLISVSYMSYKLLVLSGVFDNQQSANVSLREYPKGE